MPDKLVGTHPRGHIPYETDGDARQKIRIKVLKETNLGVAQAFFDPKGDHAKTGNQIRATVILIALKIDGVWFFHIDISLRTTLCKTCIGKSFGFPS